jgi:PAS domain S-box-containing protein
MSIRTSQTAQKLQGEWKRDSRKFLETEQRFSAIFEQSPYGIVIIDTTGKIIEFNQAAHQDLGYTREEFADLSLSDIDPFETPEEIRRSMSEVLEKGEAGFEVRHRTKEGEIRDVNVIARVVNLSGRRVFQTIWQDITERKLAEKTLSRYREHLEALVRERTAELAKLNEELQKDIAIRKLAEEKLRESEERFRRIFEDGPLGIVIFSPNFRIINTNKAMCQMLGYTKEELSGRSLEDITYPEDKKKTIELAGQMLRGEVPLFQLEKRCVKKNGDILWTSMTTTALRNQDGEVGYALCMVEDIGNRKSIEHEREILIHELRVAMANIKTLKGLLPTCAWCKKVRDDNGHWQKVETYIEEHSDASFTHGICPDCLKENDPESYTEYEDRKRE